MRKAILAAFAALAVGLYVTGTAVAWDPPPDTNRPPIANAGADRQLTRIGVWEPLSALGSYDPDDEFHTLSFYWFGLSIPEACTPLCYPQSASAYYTQFYVGAYGSYLFRLRVCDPHGACDYDDVTFTFVNLPPVGDAGAAISAVVGDLVTLDGSASSDPNGDALTFAWSLIGRPEGSQAVLYDTTTAHPVFTPDVPGTYVASLVVSDGALYSAPVTVQIEVVSVLSAATSIIMQAVEIVRGLNEDEVKNLKLQKAYANKVNALLHKVEDGDYLDAMIKLQDDLQAKANGCRDSTPPMPDKNDWVLSCDAQALLTDLGMELYDFLEARLP